MREIDQQFIDAARDGDIAKMEQLWQQTPKPDVNARDNDDGTPLHEAALNGHTDAMQLLKSFGADVNARTKDGWTPLHFAASSGHTEAMQLLKSFGADVNARNINGLTPLHWAASNDEIGAMQLLKSFGAFVNAQDNDGITPRVLAEQYDAEQAVNFLAQWEAEAASHQPPTYYDHQLQEIRQALEQSTAQVGRIDDQLQALQQQLAEQARKNTEEMAEIRRMVQQLALSQPDNQPAQVAPVLPLPSATPSTSQGPLAGCTAVQTSANETSAVL